MRLSFSGRLALDLALVAFWLLALVGRPLGERAHEFLGLAAMITFGFHLALNRARFTGGFKKGHLAAKPHAKVLINWLLLLTILTVLVTGLAQSRFVLGFLNLGGGLGLRRAHTLMAYWSLVLAALHVGLNWPVIYAFIVKKLNINTKKSFLLQLNIVILLIISVFGIKSFVNRHMLHKLFLGYSFEFWNPEKHQIFLFIEYVFIFSFLVVLTRFIKKLGNLAMTRVDD